MHNCLVLLNNLIREKISPWLTLTVLINCLVSRDPFCTFFSFFRTCSKSTLNTCGQLQKCVIIIEIETITFVWISLTVDELCFELCFKPANSSIDSTVCIYHQSFHYSNGRLYFVTIHLVIFCNEYTHMCDCVLIEINECFQILFVLKR